MPTSMLVAFVVLGLVLLVCLLLAWRLIFSEGTTQRDFRSEFAKDEAERQVSKSESPTGATKLSPEQASAETVESKSDSDSEQSFGQLRQPESNATDLENDGTIRSSDTIKNSEPSSFEAPAAGGTEVGDVDAAADDLDQPVRELHSNTDLASRQTVDSMGDKSINSDDVEES